MPGIPTLDTKRLRLRALRLSDGGDVQRLAGDPAVAATTLLIPHPYEDGMAEAWIGTHAREFEEGRGCVFAIARREDDVLVGAIGLTLEAAHARAELGYWIGVPYWGHGYATEAGRAVLRFGFAELRLNRIFAHHMTSNPASGRVLVKIGMQHEGCVRQHVRKDGVFRDLDLYGVLA